MYGEKRRLTREGLVLMRLLLLGSTETDRSYVVKRRECRCHSHVVSILDAIGEKARIIKIFHFLLI